MTSLSHKQREALHAWPNWVDDLRGDGYRVATNGTREKLGLPWDPEAAYMYKASGCKRPGETANQRHRVIYYKFTQKRAPEKFQLEVWR